MTDIGKTAHLKQLLFSLEKDLGIHELGTVQQNILYAASLLKNRDDPIETDDIRQHELVASVARSSFFNALKSLVDAGYLRHIDGAKRSQYVLTKKVQDGV
ncbi:hypothetical protein [Pseudorhodobacter ferrugineus]|uniref:hypothetical protein n=1 Tax=Pseudorhodobacter ferrugineus TaxID=77008 RepID=UPI000A9EEC3D|nr:hypothetical protein [Pseudorhodobacter ferrugineus]